MFNKIYLIFKKFMYSSYKSHTYRYILSSFKLKNFNILPCIILKKKLRFNMQLASNICVVFVLITFLGFLGSYLLLNFLYHQSFFLKIKEEIGIS